jgi:hypothetical protein
LENGSQKPGMFRNVVLERNGDQSTDRVRNEVMQRLQEERNIPIEIKRREANWTGHMLRSNCLLKHVIEESDGNTRKKRQAAIVWS